MRLLFLFLGTVALAMGGYLAVDAYAGASRADPLGSLRWQLWGDRFEPQREVQAWDDKITLYRVDMPKIPAMRRDNRRMRYEEIPALEQRIGVLRRRLRARAALAGR
jgi:hypothetical protein